MIAAPWATTQPTVPLLERVDHQTAQQLGVEIGALGGHPFAVFADGADVIQGGRHDQGGQREVAGVQRFDHFVDIVNVLGLGQVTGGQQVLDEQPVQDAHA